MSSVIEFMKTQTAEQRAIAEERLAFLTSAANSKNKNYKADINNMFLNPDAVGKIQIVGNRAGLFKSEIRVVQQTDAAAEKIEKIVNELFSGDMGGLKDAFVSVVKLSIGSFLGTTQMGENEFEEFYIIFEHNAFVRIDLRCWHYKFSTEGFIGGMESAFAFTYCKSIVNHESLHVDEFIYFISEKYGDAIDQVDDFSTKILALWEKFTKKSASEIMEDYTNVLLSSES